MVIFGGSLHVPIVNINFTGDRLTQKFEAWPPLNLLRTLVPTTYPNAMQIRTRHFRDQDLIIPPEVNLSTKLYPLTSVLFYIPTWAAKCSESLVSSGVPSILDQLGSPQVKKSSETRFIVAAICSNKKSYKYARQQLRSPGVFELRVLQPFA